MYPYQFQADISNFRVTYCSSPFPVRIQIIYLVEQILIRSIHYLWIFDQMAANLNIVKSRSSRVKRTLNVALKFAFELNEGV